MKNILFEEKKIKLCSEWHFMENKTDCVAALRCSKFPLLSSEG
jgi:hypothetical protein